MFWAFIASHFTMCYIVASANLHMYIQQFNFHILLQIFPCISCAPSALTTMTKMGSYMWSAPEVLVHAVYHNLALYKCRMVAHGSRLLNCYLCTCKCQPNSHVYLKLRLAKGWNKGIVETHVSNLSKWGCEESHAMVKLPTHKFHPLSCMKTHFKST